jgi:hypothetical protein
MQVIGTFKHQDGQAQVPCLAVYDSVENDFLLLSGSAILFERFDRPENTTLTLAAKSVREYTQDCVDQSFTVPDCASFGGHIHVATVTRDGFSWVIPPIAG